MKKVIIEYSYTMKDGSNGKATLIANIENKVPNEEAIVEAKRDFYEDNGFYKCFDVQVLKVESIAGCE